MRGLLTDGHIGDESEQMWHTRWSAGTDWSTNHRKDNAQSRRAPALASFDADLHMVHIGQTSYVIYHTVRDSP